MSLEVKVGHVNDIVDAVNAYWIKHQGELWNHKDFWDNTLHAFNNTDWEIMMEVMEVVKIEDPRCYISSAQRAFDEVRKILMHEAHSNNPKALDTRKNKKTAFRGLMNVKDVFNNFTGYQPPSKFTPPPPPNTPFEDLFKIL